jgi:hypothetical protein
MVAKLIKDKHIDDFYYLKIGINTYATTLEDSFRVLSLKNCDELFGVVDVEKLADEYIVVKSKYREHEHNLAVSAYKQGFNKAMELYKDKVFTLEDMKRAIFNFANYDYQNMSELEGRDKAIQSLQQPTEIEVEIDMSNIYAVPEPKLDSEGCLILKKI